MPLSVRYGLNTSTLRGFRLPLLETVDIAAKVGYQAIEPWIEEIDRYVAEGGSLPDLKKKIEDAGLTVEGAIGFFEWIVDDEEKRKAALEEAKRNMSLLAQIGGIRIAAPAMGAVEQADTDLLKIAGRYRTLLEIGSSEGVIPLVEVWGFSKTLSRLGEAAYVAIESGHPQACILADVYHLYKGRSGYGGLHALQSSLLPVLHVNDFPDIPQEQIGDGDRVYPGDGIAPFPEIIQALETIGFDGVLSLELFNEAYWKTDPLTVAKTGLEKTRAVFGAGQ